MGFYPPTMRINSTESRAERDLAVEGKESDDGANIHGTDIGGPFPFVFFDTPDQVC